MSSNAFGNPFRFTTYGESHGAAVGVVIDGCPAGLELDMAQIQTQLDRRKPAQQNFESQRQEFDIVHLDSGLFEGITTAAPLHFFVHNQDAKSKDYTELQQLYRPGHADQVYDLKYGIRDHKGGGRSSARETIGRIIAGSVARQILAQLGIELFGFVDQIGNIWCETDPSEIKLSEVEASPLRCPDAATAKRMQDLLEHIRIQGDTIGGCVRCVVKGIPAGLGSPIYDKLNARLAYAMLSINAVRGFEMGAGFRSAEIPGSKQNDRIVQTEAGTFESPTNHSGGVSAGISNGLPLSFRVAFKSISSIQQAQPMQRKDGSVVEHIIGGRHDVCVVPRAVPIVEAMCAVVVLNAYLQNQYSKLSNLKD